VRLKDKEAVPSTAAALDERAREPVCPKRQDNGVQTNVSRRACHLERTDQFFIPVCVDSS
jgi:hypothetical protein